MNGCTVSTRTHGRASTARLKIMLSIDAFVIRENTMGTDDGAGSHVTGAQAVGAKLLSALVQTDAARRLRVVRIWRGRNWTTLVIPSVPLPSLRTLRKRRVGMIRQAATQVVAPVPPKLWAIRTGGRSGRIGRSTVRKAGGLWMIPRYATTLETFEWNQRVPLPELIIRAVIRAGVARGRRRGRAATLVLVPLVAILASRIARGRGGRREAAGLVCQKG
jgi:hypothetical protein